MSADFWSFAVVMPVSEARSIASRFEASETHTPITSRSGDVLHDFDGQGLTVDLRAIERACRGEDPNDLGRAYVEADIDALGPLLEDQIAMSSSYPSIVVLDRALALPHGVQLLGGRAVAVLTSDQLIGVSDRLSAVMGALGPTAVNQRIARHLDRSGQGEADAREILDLLDRRITETFEAGTALLLLGIVAP